MSNKNDPRRWPERCKRTLANLHPEDFVPAISRGLGSHEDRWYWSPHTPRGQRALERLRAVKLRRFGVLAASGRTDGEYLRLAASLPTEFDAIEQRLGNPTELFGTVPGYGGHALHALSIWRAICAERKAQQEEQTT